MAWRDTVLERARAAFSARRPMVGPVLVNLWARRRGGRLSYQVEVFDDLDDAAADAASPSIYGYAGTLMAAPDGTAALLDLTAHGDAVRGEAAEAAAEEERLECGLRQGAGRIVL